MKKQLTYDTKLIEQLLKAPEVTIEQLNLIYVNDQKLTILRRKKGKEFSYFVDEKTVSKKQDLNRIKSLVIPPAWEQVRISSLDNGRLQAVGRDVKKRKQYRYHPPLDQDQKSDQIL